MGTLHVCVRLEQLTLDSWLVATQLRPQTASPSPTGSTRRGALSAPNSPVSRGGQGSRPGTAATARSPCAVLSAYRRSEVPGTESVGLYPVLSAGSAITSAFARPSTASTARGWRDLNGRGSGLDMPLHSVAPPMMTRMTTARNAVYMQRTVMRV